jgi:SAM-dependent methyltransferase
LDLARHHAAYEIARRHAGTGRVIDVGCGSGYGAASLASGAGPVVGIDRVLPDRSFRGDGARFVLGDLRALPLVPKSFDLVVSFQVIEHLEDPTFYVDALAELLRPDGLAIVTTPNIETSDGVNPYHVHEYTGDELAACLTRRFGSVDVQGISPSPPARRILEERSRRIRRIMRLDPLRLHQRLPTGLVEWLFAKFALLVRNTSSGPSDDETAITWRDFPVGPASADCLDLLAFCRQPH